MSVENIFKQNTVNAIVIELQLIYSGENLKVAFAQLCNQIKGCNFTMVYLTQN